MSVASTEILKRKINWRDDRAAALIGEHRPAALAGGGSWTQRSARHVAGTP